MKIQTNTCNLYFLKIYSGIIDLIKNMLSFQITCSLKWAKQYLLNRAIRKR